MPGGRLPGQFLYFEIQSILKCQRRQVHPVGTRPPEFWVQRSRREGVANRVMSDEPVYFPVLGIGSAGIFSPVSPGSRQALKREIIENFVRHNNDVRLSLKQRLQRQEERFIKFVGQAHVVREVEQIRSALRAIAGKEDAACEPGH